MTPDPGEGDREVNEAKSWADAARSRLVELKQQHDAAAAEVDAIVERRRQHVLGAISNEKPAQAALDKLTAEEQKAATRLRDLAFAIEEVGRQISQHEERADQTATAERIVERAKHAAAALAAAIDMDRCAKAFVEAQGRLVAAHSGLARTKLIDSAVLNRLIYKPNISRGLIRHGFWDFTEMPRYGTPLQNSTFEELVVRVVGRKTIEKEAA
jgi:hypothetical protein